MNRLWVPLVAVPAKVSAAVVDCHETTTRGGTRLESVVPGIEPCIARLSYADCGLPVCDVLVAYARLLLVECLRPKQGTSNQGKRSSGEEL